MNKEIRCVINGCNKKAMKTAKVFGINDSTDIITGEYIPIINKKEILIRNSCKKHFRQIKKCDNFIEEIKRSK